MAPILSGEEEALAGEDDHCQEQGVQAHEDNAVQSSQIKFLQQEKEQICADGEQGESQHHIHHGAGPDLELADLNVEQGNLGGQKHFLIVLF